VGKLQNSVQLNKERNVLASFKNVFIKGKKRTRKCFALWGTSKMISIQLVNENEMELKNEISVPSFGLATSANHNLFY